MPRGGKREGAGRKPRLDPKLAFKIGLRCEVLWRESYKTNFAGMHWVGEKRPRTRKTILRQVADEFGETIAMVERRWKAYRRFEADLRNDDEPN
jgi:hypothetical protein